MLTYHPQFNTFYNLNNKNLDMWIWSVAWRYQHIAEAEDIFQEVMLRLLKSTVLKDWNEEKGAALDTYITTRIRGYALHFITKIMREEPEAKYFVRLDRYHDYGETEHDSETPGKGYFLDVFVEPEEETVLLAKEILALFKRTVNPLQAKAFELYYMEGYTYEETATIINESMNTKHSYFHIRAKCNQAVESMYKLLSSEGVNCER